MFFLVCTLQETNISHQKWHVEDDFPFPTVGYVNSLEGNRCWQLLASIKKEQFHGGTRVKLHFDQM